MDLSTLMQISPCLQLSIFNSRTQSPMQMDPQKAGLGKCCCQSVQRVSYFSQLLFFKLKLSINHIDENQWTSEAVKVAIDDHHCLFPPNVWLLFAFILVVLMFFQSSIPFSSIDVLSSY